MEVQPPEYGISNSGFYDAHLPPSLIGANAIWLGADCTRTESWPIKGASTPTPPSLHAGIRTTQQDLPARRPFRGGVGREVALEGETDAVTSSASTSQRPPPTGDSNPVHGPARDRGLIGGPL